MSTFKQWFRENLAEDYADDIANHGADAGYPHIMYYTDTTKIYDQYQEDIHEMLVEDSESMGYDTPEEMIAQFNRKDMLSGGIDQRKCLLVWYACERTAHEVSDA